MFEECQYSGQLPHCTMLAAISFESVNSLKAELTILTPSSRVLHFILYEAHPTDIILFDSRSTLKM